jgi:hypothetical protein
MSSFGRNLVPFLLTAALFGQNAGRQTLPHRVVWGPPNLELPSTFPKASVKNEIVKGLKVGDWPIILETTELAQAQRHFGAVVGSRGDASEALAWICLRGSDDKGTWALWLYSGEIDGPAIGGFQWQRISQGLHLDRRCKLLSSQQGSVELPIHVSLGMSKAEVVAALGRPSGMFRNLAIYSHEHDVELHNEPYTVDNDVIIEYREAAVSTIAVNHTTSN